MKLALIQCANGAFSIVSEHGDNEQAALVAFHDRCKIMWNAPDAYKVEIAIVDEQLDIYKGYKELITHEPQAEE
jgi:hypothetical protein